VKVLVLNSGSSTVKFHLYELDEPVERTLAEGRIESFGDAALVHLAVAGQRPAKDTANLPDHKAAVEYVLSLVTRGESGLLSGRGEIEAVGHRVVHGGERFQASVRIDDAVLAAIEDCFALAPLHNPANVKGYRAVKALLGDVPQVAVFDTAFHQTLEPRAYLYALPSVLYERLGIRRYGFHGTSHRYVSEHLARRLGRAGDPELRLITCHLGNGCSLAAIRGGRSVDTSMGFTPLEGLVMGSRSGDLDPAILPFLMTQDDMNGSELSSLLNRHSGLLGLSGLSNDMRTLLDAEAAGNPRARLAIDVFAYRLRKYVAAYVGVLGGIDAVAFAGGIGENAPRVRKAALEGLDALGLRLDDARNEAARGQEAEISPAGSSPRVFVVPTNEEILIARDTYAIVRGRALA
jgi:acetate kinase